MTDAATQPDPWKDDTLEKALQAWSDARGRTTLLIVTTQRPWSLSEGSVSSVWAEMVDQHDAVDLVIHSAGGDPNAAYQIIEILRRHTRKELTAVVPFRAASAATLMCLGCDSIMLNELARLGPLDMQVYEDMKGGAYRYRSALNPREAIRQMFELSLTSLKSTKTALIADNVLADEAYEIAVRFVTGLFQPLYAQVNPERLAEYSRHNAVTHEYALRLLKRYAKARLSAAQQKALADKLVHGYPSHQYSIDYTEASEIGLPIVAMPDDLDALSTRLLAQIWNVEYRILKANPTATPTPTPSETAQPASEPPHETRKRTGGRRKRTPVNGGGVRTANVLPTKNGRR